MPIRVFWSGLPSGRRSDWSTVHHDDGLYRHIVCKLPVGGATGLRYTRRSVDGSLLAIPVLYRDISSRFRKASRG